VETLGALEAAEEEQEHPAVLERAAAALAPEGVLEVGLVERSLPVLARQARLPEAVVVAAR
jgi:hypothetical protein